MPRVNKGELLAEIDRQKWTKQWRTNPGGLNRRRQTRHLPKSPRACFYGYYLKPDGVTKQEGATQSGIRLRSAGDRAIRRKKRAEGLEELEIVQTYYEPAAA